MAALADKCAGKKEIGLDPHQKDVNKYSFLPFGKLTQNQFNRLFENVETLLNFEIHLYNCTPKLKNVSFPKLNSWVANDIQQFGKPTQVLVAMNCSNLEDVSIGRFSNYTLGKKKVMADFNPRLNNRSIEILNTLMNNTTKEENPLTTPPTKPTSKRNLVIKHSKTTKMKAEPITTTALATTTEAEPIETTSEPSTTILSTVEATTVADTSTSSTAMTTDTITTGEEEELSNLVEPESVNEWKYEEDSISNSLKYLIVVLLLMLSFHVI